MDTIWLLVPVAFVSSMLTAVLGIGGGVLWISVMPGLIVPAAVIPVHGVVQLASNASRALFARAGTRIRAEVQEERFRTAFKILLTVFALRLILRWWM